MTDEEKQRAETIISNLEVATGQILSIAMGDAAQREIVSRMIENLNALRSLLGLVKRRG